MLENGAGKMCIRDRQWVDRAYSADLLVQLFDYYGTLKHGFLNSVLSQKDLSLIHILPEMLWETLTNAAVVYLE